MERRSEMKCPKCESTRVSGKYEPKYGLSYCPAQKCYDCGFWFKVDSITGRIKKKS